MSFSLELLHYWRSSCSWRVRWVLELKNLSYKSTPVNLLKDEHKSAHYYGLNPTKTVPTLLVNGSPMRESLAIIEWLEEKFPTPALLPTDPDSRARVRELAYTIAMGIQPIQNLKVLNYVSSDPTNRIRFARHWIKEGFDALERKLQLTAGSYCFGSQLTLADICLVPQVYNASRFGVDLTALPLIREISDRCLALAACERAAPSNQPGAKP